MGKKNTFNYSRNRQKLGRKEKAKLKIKNPIINSAWRHELSVKSNFNNLGIAYDSNELLGIPQRQFFTHKVEPQSRICKKKTDVVIALEKIVKKKKHIPVYVTLDDQLFCMYNLELYGNDFEAMSKDSKNVYQLTARQIERLINKFKETQAYKTYLKDKEDGTLDFMDDMLVIPCD